MRRSTVATPARSPRMTKEYRSAMAEYRRLVNYYKGALKVLPQAECDLLSEFVEISKRKCQRLRRALDRQSGKHSSAA